MHGYTDTHFHILQMREKGWDVDAVLEEDFQSVLSSGIDVGVGPEDFDNRLEAASLCPGVFHAAGLSPFWASVSPVERNQALVRINEQLKHPRVIALGEIGLDWYWNYGDRKSQIRLFKQQLLLAGRNKLPVIIHNRDADEDIVSILESQRPERAGILHCFSADLKTAHRLIDMGFLISFAGNLTYKKADNLREVLRGIPLSSVVFETDSPYLSPVPLRGKPNRPGYVRNVYEYASEVLQVNIDQLKDRVYENILTLFPMLAHDVSSV